MPIGWNADCAPSRALCTSEAESILLRCCKPMKIQRRDFFKAAAGLSAVALIDKEAKAAAAGPTFITGKPRMKLGIVTYNIAKDWDVPTIIKNCTETKF